MEIFESADRLGGVLATHRLDGFLIERGADSFISKVPSAVELCHELELADELIPTNPENRRALILHKGQLQSVPEGFVLIRPHRVGPILRSPLLSWWGKLRLVAERWRRPPPSIGATNFDDNLAHFATARLGREAFERIVEPLVAGIYTADATKLSVAATMPDAIDALRERGTLWKLEADLTPATSGARYDSFLTLRGGVGQLVDRLAACFPQKDVHLNSKVSTVSRQNQNWLLHESDGSTIGPFDGIVLALPAYQSATLIDKLEPELAEFLCRIEYASSAVVSLAYRQEQITRPLDGFGFVVPRIEHRNIVAASFSSVKFPGRAPEGAVLVRVFLGGALRPDLLSLNDMELLKTAQDELASIMSIEGEPLAVEVVRWDQKMPQYHVGHRQLVDMIEARLESVAGLALAGNAYRGVGIPYCINRAYEAANQIASQYAG